MIVVATSGDTVAEVSRRLHDLGVAGVGATDTRAGRWLVRGSAADDADGERVAAQLRSEGLIAVARPDGGVRLDAWTEHTRPRRFGDRVSVCLAWSEHDRSALPGLVELGLGGFGNGAHPTTAMLIDQLVGRIAGGERVLDVGCGSGVLGLCALRLGAARLVAVDTKPAAVEATRRNAELNGLGAMVTATSDGLDRLDGPFDVIVANVGRSALVELGADLVRLLAPDGWLAISGFSPSQRAQVGAFLRPLVEIADDATGEWSAAVLAGSQSPRRPDAR